MSLEAIETICQAEEAVKKLKADAVANAKRAVAAAEEEGRLAMEQLANKVAEELKAKNEQAQAKAGAEAEAILEKAREEKDELRKKAEGRLDKAAEYIVERIVNG